MRWLLPVVACHVVLWGGWSTALHEAALASEEPGKTPSEAPAEPAPPSLKEAPPIYLMDEGGKPQAILGWTLKEFEELRERAEAQQQPDRPPRYILQSMSATGSVERDLAELTIEFKIWASDSEVRVPLRLDQAILPPGGSRYQGAGKAVLQFEQEGEGHVLWILGDPEQEHRLTLRVLAPLSTVGDQTRLRLFVPHATSSELKLTVPVAGAVAEVSGGATLLPLSEGRGESTVFTVAFGGEDANAAKFNDFQLTWRKAPSHLPTTRPVLEAVGLLLAKVDRRSVTTEATLTVRGHGDPFDRFRVALPERAQLIPGNGAGYSVRTVSGDEAAGDETVVEVRRDKNSPEPMEVRLTTRQPREAAAAGGWFQLGGFEVIDAVRQSGYLAISSVGDSQLRCAPDWGVRQIGELPEPLQTSEVAVGFDYLFEYFSQPFSLAARVVEVKTRIRVEPEYRIYVEQSQAQLEATLKYAIRGAKAFALDVELPGWDLDEVESDGVVAVDDVWQRSGVLSMPLMQPSMGEIEVSIRAHQEIEPGANSLSLALPRPRADSLSPAVVAVLPADNVELRPDLEAMVGLVPEQVLGHLALRRGQQDPLFYRLDVEETREAVFAAGFEVHQQKIAVEVTSEVTLGSAQAEVRQTLAYVVEYEPLDELTIEVPRSVAGSDSLDVLLDGQSLAPAPLPDPADTPDPSRPIRMRIMLRPARIGRCKLEVRYAVARRPLRPGTSVICKIPLVMPVEGEFVGNKLYVTAPKGVEVYCRGQRWQVLGGPGGGVPWGNGLALSGEEPAGEVELTIRHEDLVATTVERAWIQTCFTRHSRRERAVFRFTTDQKELQLILPKEFNRGRVEVFLSTENAGDRRRVNVPMREGQVVIPLADESNRRRRWLEVRCDVSDPRPGPGRLSLELPHLGGEVWVQQAYWELVLPQNEHVVVGPQGFTAECQWGWNGSFWGRRPLMESAQLEAWSGAGPGMELPKATSRYLFSSLGPVTRCELRTASRWSIVLAASSVVLAAGLLLIYFPPCRHPAALLAAALALGGAAVLYPGPALLASQAGGVGLLLALVAGVLYRTVGPGRGGIVRREPSSSVLDRSSTQAQRQLPAASQPASTETVPAEIPMPTSDPNS